MVHLNVRVTWLNLGWFGVPRDRQFAQGTAQADNCYMPMVKVTSKRDEVDTRVQA